MTRATDPHFEPMRRPYRYEHADPELERLKQGKKRKLNEARRRRAARRKKGPK